MDTLDREAGVPRTGRDYDGATALIRRAAGRRIASRVLVDPEIADSKAPSRSSPQAVRAQADRLVSIERRYAGAVRPLFRQRRRSSGSTLSSRY